MLNEKELFLKYDEKCGATSRYESNLNCELTKNISVLLYSDLVCKGGLIINYKEYLKSENEVEFGKLGFLKLSNGKECTNRVIKIGSVNIVITDRTEDSKYRYCARIMNSEYTKTYKRLFVNDLEDINNANIIINNEEIKITNEETIDNNSLYETIETDNCEDKKIIDWKNKLYNEVVVNTIVNVRKIKKFAISMFQKVAGLFTNKNK